MIRYAALVAIFIISGCTQVVVNVPPDLDAGPDPYEDGGYPYEDAGYEDDADVPPPPVDAGMDAGPADAGMDAGMMDAGIDAGMDAGPPPCVCPDDGNPCTDDYCNVADECVHPPMAEETLCSTTPGESGKCFGGTCCEGCWDGVTCHAGTAIAHCGDYGEICLNCDLGSECSQETCELHELSEGGHCMSLDINEDLACNGGTGLCDAGQCDACGAAGEQCCPGDTCGGSDLLCWGGVCELCGGVGEQCCDSGDACEAGGVCDGAAFMPHCESCGGQDEPCCDTGAACGAGLECNVGGTCSCGSEGEICCAGNTCPNARLCFDGMCFGEP